MSACVVDREHVDRMVWLAPEVPGGVRVRRSGARYVEHRRHGGTDGLTTHTDQVPVETQDGVDEPVPPAVPPRSEFGLDMMTTPGFISEWSFE